MTTHRSISNQTVAGLICLTLILAAVVFFAWKNYWKWAQDNQVPQNIQQTSRVVEVVPVVRQTLFIESQLPAEIEAYQDVLIYPKIPGFIKWIGVDRGSVVKKGDLMVSMYAPEYIARRNESLAKVAAAKAALAAEQSLLKDIEADLRKRQANLLADQSTYQRVNAASLVPGVIAENDVVQWSQTVEADRQEVNMVIKRVNAKEHEVATRRQEVEADRKVYDDLASFSSYLELRAPFNGYVTERTMHVGSFVGPDGTGAYPPICRLKQLDLLRIVVPVAEVNTAGVVAGSEVRFSVSSFPGRIFSGTVARISNDLHKATRTMPVELNYFNPNYTILPGMFCQVYWPIHRRASSMFVPITAVVTTPLDSFACRVKDDIVEWVSVTKGQIMNNMVEVFGDLHEGDRVAKVASEEIQNKSHVKTVVTK